MIMRDDGKSIMKLPTLIMNHPGICLEGLRKTMTAPQSR